MTINERVSDLIHSEIADFFAGFGSPGEPEIQNGDAQKQLSARIDAILQQYRAAAEPVAWVMKDDLADTDIISTPAYLSFSDAVTKTVGKLIPLYAAPQVTSVPDESAIFDAAIDICRKSDAIDEHAWNRGVLAVMSAFRACRAVTAAPAAQAEQLSGNTEPVSQPYTLTFDQWLSQQSGKIEVECGCVTTEAFFHWLRVAYEAGNSPAIPDGWIPVSERMPDETQPVIVVTGGGVVQRTVYQFCDGVWIDWYEQYDEVPHDAFTHWMPLPAAPRQEAE